MTSSASAGCHRLIRDYAAVCVTTAAEMAELVDPDAATIDVARGDRPSRTRVLDALTPVARDVSRVAVLSGLSLYDVRSELALLEAEGVVEESAHGWRRAGR